MGEASFRGWSEAEWTYGRYLVIHVVLVRPQIPQNTGNIARLCAGTDAHLHLVGDLGFSLEDRYLKRAGLDYWPHVKLHLHDTLEEALAPAEPENIACFSTHASVPYDTFRPEGPAYLVFGRETSGLEAPIHERFASKMYTIPHNGKIRSLNLANSVAITVYDQLRHRGFPLQKATP